MWPFKEKRAAGGTATSYTDEVVTSIIRRNTGDGNHPEGLSIVQSAVALIQRQFESAHIDGDKKAVDAISPYLSWVAANMSLRGEAFLYLDEQENVIPSTLQSVVGNPGTPVTYKLNTLGASKTGTVSASASSVLSFINNPRRENPWRGTPPLEKSALTGAASAQLEKWFELISKQLPVNLVVLPETLDRKQSDGIGEVINDAAECGNPAVFGSQDGKSPTLLSSAVSGGSTSRADLRAAFSAELSGLIGVPYALLVAGTAGGNTVRESLRNFHRLTLRPFATIIEKQVMAKTGLSLAISFPHSSITDHQAQARAMKSYVDGGLTVEQASHILGLQIEGL